MKREWINRMGGKEGRQAGRQRAERYKESETQRPELDVLSMVLIPKYHTWTIR